MKIYCEIMVGKEEREEALPSVAEIGKVRKYER